MKRLRMTLMILMAATVAVAPLASTALANPSPPALELVLSASPLAAATLEQAAETAQVEAPPVTSWNPSDWFADAAVLGGVIAALVALLKANFLKNLHGLGTLALSFGLGIGLSLLGTITWPVIGRPNELTGVAAIIFGVNASVIASGGWDVIKGLLMAVFGGNSRGAAEAST